MSLTFYSLLYFKNERKVLMSPVKCPTERTAYTCANHVHST